MSIDQYSPRLDRIAGVAAVASLPFTAANALLGWAAFDFRGDALRDPASVLHLDGVDAGLFRLSMVADIAGFYVPLILVALALRSRLARADPAIADTATLCGAAAGIVGAAGAAVFAGSVAALSHHATVDPAGAAAAFEAVAGAVFRGAWNLANWTLIALWLGLAAHLVADRAPRAARLAALGAALAGANAIATAVRGEPATALLVPALLVWSAALPIGGWQLLRAAEVTPARP